MTSGLLNIQFIVRQIVRSRRQAIVLVLCVALSIVTLISLNGFSASVNTSLLKDAKSLQAADIIIQSYQEISPGTLNIIQQLENQNQIISNRIWEFYSVVRSQKSQDSLLAKSENCATGISILRPGGAEVRP